MDLSEEQKEKLFRGMLEDIREYNSEQITKTNLTTSDIEHIIGVDSVDELLDTNNDNYLSVVYEPLLVSQGYGSFKSLVDDSRDNDDMVYKRAPKDLSKLNKEERTVIRNGKPMKTTIYTDGGKGDYDPKGNQLDDNGNEKPQEVVASEMKAKPSPNPSNDDKASELESEGSKKYKEIVNLEPLESFDSFTVLEDEEGFEQGIILFKYENGYVKLVKYGNLDTVENMLGRAYSETILKAWQENLGVMLPCDDDTSLADNIAKYFEMNRVGNIYFLDKDEVINVLGERP